VKPVLLDIKIPKHSLPVHLQLYQLALAVKEQLSTASAVFGNYDSTQLATPILVTQKTELIWQNFWLSNTKCIQSACSILGLSISHIIRQIVIAYRMLTIIYIEYGSY